jgi:hypothetical protein
VTGADPPVTDDGVDGGADDPPAPAGEPFDDAATPSPGPATSRPLLTRGANQHRSATPSPTGTSPIPVSVRPDGMSFAASGAPAARLTIGGLAAVVLAGTLLLITRRRRALRKQALGGRWKHSAG